MHILHSLPYDRDQVERNQFEFVSMWDNCDSDGDRWKCVCVCVCFFCFRCCCWVFAVRIVCRSITATEQPIPTALMAVPFILLVTAMSNGSYAAHRACICQWWMPGSLRLTRNEDRNQIKSRKQKWIQIKSETARRFGRKILWMWKRHRGRTVCLLWFNSFTSLPSTRVACVVRQVILILQKVCLILCVVWKIQSGLDVLIGTMFVSAHAYQEIRMLEVVFVPVHV